MLISCPKCGRKSYGVPYGEDAVRSTCFRCGYTSTEPSNGRSFYWYDENPTDILFVFNLCLQTECVGNSLWVFSEKHLQFLESFEYNTDSGSTKIFTVTNLDLTAMMPGYS